MIKEEIISLAKCIGLLQPKDFKIPIEITEIVEQQEKTHPGKPASYYRFFYHLSRMIKPKLCVELGTNKGVAAVCLAIGNKEGKVITIDNEDKEIPDSCQLGNIEFWIQDSLDKPQQDLQNIDILFIDTSSKGSRNRAEYDFWVNRVKDGGLIFIDDIFIVKDHTGEIKTDRMAEFWNIFKPEGEKIELPLHGENGFGLVIKKKRRKLIPHIELKGKYYGKDIYIIGSGASMNYLNRSFFKDKIVIGINGVWEAFPATYSLFKHEHFIQAAIDGGQIVISSKHDCGDITKEEVKIAEIDYIFTHKRGRFGDLEGNFQENLDAIGKDDDIFVSYSSITSGIHLAAYMGAKNIIICGHDCGWINGKAHIEAYGNRLINYYESEKKFNEYHNGWFERINQDSIRLKKKLIEVYGCNIYSLNPFINFKLEGNKYDTQK